MTGMVFLKKLAKADHTRSLKFMLHNHLSGSEKDRPKTNVHASELTKDEGMCPREYALSDSTKKKPGNRWLNASENVTFTMGRMLQDIVVESFAEMGKSIGHWRCVVCSHLHEFQSRPFKCVQCGMRQVRPEEVRFQSAVNGASCGVDMLLALGETKLRAIEIKTMDKDQFKILQAPLAEHKLRTTLYLRLIAESDHNWASMVNQEKATILYVSKGGYGCADPSLKVWGLKEQFSPFKEFEITRNDAMVQYLCNRAKVVKDYRDGKIGMPSGVCVNAFAKRAQHCGFKGECFSGEFPPTHNWKASA